ncbi:MAG: tetratricopeptide repeat protein [Lewinellaceae bacterium]|nr:tetratricopeptide repeat protein [Lewinellaceae bacterium]
MAVRKGKKSSDEIIDVVEVKGSNVHTEQGFFEKNQNILSYIILGIGVLAALYYAYKYLYVAPREKEAVEAIYKAEQQFAKDSFALALENPGGGYDGFLAIIDNFGGTKTANLAKYYAGISYLNLGSFQEAVDYLNDYSAHDAVTKITKDGALGDAYSGLGDMDKAESYYVKAAGHGENEFLTPYYKGKLATFFQSQGKMDDAIKLWDEIAANYPETNEGKDAEKYLQRYKN